MKTKKILIFLLFLGLLIPFSSKATQHSHTWTTQTKAPTLLEDGFIASVCECGTIKDKQIIPALKVTVVRVVDGDTIVVKSNNAEYKVRFIGINTPESVSADESKNTPEGTVASNYTKSLLKEGQTIYLEYDVDYFDKYNRILAYPWLIDITDKEITDDLFNTYNIGAIILQNTYCESVYYKPNGKYKAKYDALYKQYQPYKEPIIKTEEENVIQEQTTQTPTTQTDTSLIAQYEKIVENKNINNIIQAVKKIKTVTLNKVTGIKGKKKGKQKILLTWNNIDGAQKYEVQIALSKNMKKYPNSAETTNTKIITSKLKRKRTYYFRVRAINGEYKGKWSKVIKVKL